MARVSRWTPIPWTRGSRMRIKVGNVSQSFPKEEGTRAEPLCLHALGAGVRPARNPLARKSGNRPRGKCSSVMGEPTPAVRLFGPPAKGACPASPPVVLSGGRGKSHAKRLSIEPGGRNKAPPSVNPTGRSVTGKERPELAMPCRALASVGAGAGRVYAQKRRSTRQKPGHSCGAGVTHPAGMTWFL